MTNSDETKILSLVREQITLIQDPIVREALASRAGRPILHMRNWDYGLPGEQYPCWTIVEDESTDTGIVYSKFGFGPKEPWGLVALSRLWFGMDCGWYDRLEDAFVESHMASALPIWDLVRADGTVVVSSVSSDEVFALRDLLDAGLERPRHHIAYRNRLLSGIP